MSRPTSELAHRCSTRSTAAASFDPAGWNTIPPLLAMRRAAVVLVPVALVAVMLGACGDDSAPPRDAETADAGSTTDAAVTDAATSTVPAPPLDPDMPTSFADATSFLYTGDSPLQTGVTPGAIDPARVVVLRGKVTTRGGAALAGVTITLVGHPEFGQTLTRADGMFDMAANGGGFLTVRYASAASLPAQRQVRTPVLDYVHLPDVALVGRDSAMTTVTMGATSMQVARGSMQTDADGSRQATVLFPAGTTASLVQPDGTTVPAAALSVRLTEYTVGPDGAQAMPGNLPATSAYTYAVELGVDEAVARVSGRDVVFDRPVFLYVENFLNMPVGEVVPVGYYDPDRSAWIGSQNGRVIKLLTAAGDLDVTGDDVADTGAALSDLGVTDAERARLAGLYAVGQTLWRTPTTHFSSWDCNWSVICTGGCSPPKEPPPCPACAGQSSRPGSIIGCERQTLGERVELAGSPLALHYQSDRVAGRTAEASLSLSLGAAGVPMGVLGTEVELLVAGQKITESVPATTLGSTVTWDGRDAYGREVMGSQPFTVRVGYRYRVVYARGIPVRLSWAALSGVPMTGNPARMDVTLFQEWRGIIRRWNNRAQGLGGWSVSDVHAYDPIGRVLHLGDGTQRDAESLGAATIETIAGSMGGSTGDGGPATEARLSGPTGLSLGPDGSLYIADNGNLRVRRIAPDGVITTFAGSTFGSSGDGGPATLAQFNQVTDVAVGPDGSVYIADAGAHLVRRVSRDGTIRAFAGNGAIAFSGDGGPATDAGMEPYGLAVGPDGSVYIADRQASRVRVVDQTGIIATFAGTSSASFTGDGGPANLAGLSGPTGVALGPDGSVFIMDRSNHRVRKVTPQGIISTVAGNGTYGATGDGAAAVLAQLGSPTRVAVAPDGNLYIADTGNNRLRTVGSDGVISTVAGTGVSGFGGDGGLAPRALLAGPSAVTISPDGTIDVAESYNHRVRRLRSALPGGSASEILLPSGDGREVYVFSGAGRHLRTLDALTSAVRATFTYGPRGLASIDDGDGNLTTVERDATTGVPTAIVAPYGHRTDLEVGADGLLSRIADPSGAAVALAYGPMGLLTTLTDPRGGVHRFAYDAVGRLERDEDPAGGVQTLTRAATATGTTVTVTTALGRATRYLFERLESGELRHVTTDPSGAATLAVRSTDGSTTVTAPDGTIDVIVPGPDPRFGMLAPIVASYTRTTPSGLARVTTRTRTTTLGTPGNPLSFATLTDTRTVSGRTWTSAYVAATRTLTVTSPARRVITTTLDLRGRVATEQVAGQELVTYGYDARGRPSTISAGVGPTLRTGSFGYAMDGLLATRTDALGRATSLTYDAVGRVASVTGPDGATTTRTASFAYDASGGLAGVTPPGRGAHAFTHDAVGLAASYTPPTVPGASAPTTLVRDADRRVTRVTFADATAADVGYDAGGRISSVTLPRGVIGYAYDAAHRVQAIAAPGSVAIAYEHDGDLLRTTTLTGPSAGRVGRTHDASHRLSSLDVNGAGAVSFAYDTDDLLVTAGALSLTRHALHGLVTASTLGVVTDAVTYDGYGELLTYSASVSGTPRLHVTYVRDAAGRITGRTETIGGVTDVYAYTYDRAGRLTNVDKNSAPVETYAYDANGNRVSATVGGASRTATTDAQDRLSADGAASFTYGATGQLAVKTTAAGDTRYTYDQLGNLLGVTLPGRAAITYLVDGHGNRVGKQVGGTLVQGFLYEAPLRPVAELDGAGAVVSRFVYGTRDNVPEYLVRAGVTYRIITDHLGSPRLVVNTSSGAITQRMDYDSFGNVTADTNPGFQPFGFAGGLYDADTRLVRFGARDYDAEAGRWTAKDPLLFRAGDANLYAYAFDDPVNFTDPSGLAGWFLKTPVGRWLAGLFSDTAASSCGNASQGESPDIANEAIQSVIPGGGSVGDAVGIALDKKYAQEISTGDYSMFNSAGGGMTNSQRRADRIGAGLEQ